MSTCICNCKLGIFRHAASIASHAWNAPRGSTWDTKQVHCLNFPRNFWVLSMRYSFSILLHSRCRQWWERGRLRTWEAYTCNRGKTWLDFACPWRNSYFPSCAVDAAWGHWLSSWWLITKIARFCSWGNWRRMSCSWLSFCARPRSWRTFGRTYAWICPDPCPLAEIHNTWWICCRRPSCCPSDRSFPAKEINANTRSLLLPFAALLSRRRSFAESPMIPSWCRIVKCTPAP